MWEALGSVLGQAVGIAISPGAIIAVILVLFSTRARLNSSLFLLGWIVGVAVPFFLVALLAKGADVATDDDASTWQGVLQLALGVLFLALAWKDWKSRPVEGEDPKPNKLFDKLADVGPGLAIGLALVLTAVSPKNLALIVSAGAEAATAGLSTGDLVVLTVIFTVIASIGVGTPVILSLVMGDKATTTLHDWRSWMTTNNATIMTVLFVVLGAKMAGSGIASLA